jgi:DNA-binding MurR/RpiR family transcriptional regulator
MKEMEQLPFRLLVKDKFPQLSPGQKKVATYLIKNPDESAFQTAFQMGRKANVSETTVIRLSYALGFEGFSMMQARIQKELLQQNHANHSATDSIGQPDGEADPFSKVIDNEISILKNLLDPTSVKDIWKAAEALIHADQILIVGHRISHAAAYWFSYTLSSLRENVILCSPSGDFFEKFSNLTIKSLVFVFSFPRYATETLKVAECAREQGVCVISVTDRLLSPVGSISDIALTTEENAETGTNSIASVISLLNLIIAGIYEKDQKRIRSHQQKLENLYSSYEVFIE